MTNTIVIILIVVVVVIAAAVGYALWKRQRTERLKARFGPEYERSVSQTDDRGKAEAELRRREKRHREMELRPLEDNQRERYEQRWTQLQGEFVDDPGGAVRGADALVTEVMEARGYPEAEFDQRADDLSVSYPELTQLYREARGVARANEEGNATTEDLRHAVTTYRSLVQHLLRDGSAEEGHEDRRREDRRHEDRAAEDRTAGDDRSADDRTVGDRSADDRGADDRGADDRGADDQAEPRAERREQTHPEHGRNGRFPTGHEGERTEEVQR